jgi:hypothetical protein
MAITSLKQLEKETARDIRDDFREWGCDHSGLTWNETLKRLASAYGLVTSSLKPVNRAASRILATCKKEFVKGKRDAKVQDS